LIYLFLSIYKILAFNNGKNIAREDQIQSVFQPCAEEQAYRGEHSQTK